MALADLNSILLKIRKLIGLPSVLQIRDQDLQDYINSFYLFDLPEEFRNLKLKDVYTFNTSRGVDVYPFDSERYTTIEQPCYCAKREIALFNDPWSFYAVNYNWQFQNNFATGDGTPGPYSGNTTSTPIIRSVNNNPGVGSANPDFPASRVQNILITANIAYGQTANVTDDGEGNLIQYLDSGLAQVVGAIDYETGAVTNLNFVDGTGAALNIPSGNEIQIQYNPVTLSIPLSILFFQNQFTLRPVPDRGYTIELIAYRQPVQAIADYITQSQNFPELKEWWELIAMGAALKFFQDNNDDANEANMELKLKKRYNIAKTRTYAQLGKQRINTIFADQLQYNYGQGSGFFGSV